MRQVFLVILVCAMVLGCGGFNREPGVHSRGSVSITIRWPEQGRQIPEGARSIKLVAVELTPNESGSLIEDETLQTKVASRPAGVSPLTTTVFDLPVGDVRIRATAHESVDGSGPVLAAGVVSIKINPDQATPANIVLSGVVASVVVSPPALNLNVGQSAALTATGKDGAGAIITVPSSDWTWSSNTPSVATVAQRATPNGNVADVAAVGVGTASVRATHVPSGAFQNVTVSVGISVTVSPSNATLLPGMTKQFSASSEGNPGASFTWSVNGGGTINTSTGLFTAGQANGVFTVTATEVGDTARNGTATVRVGLPPLFAAPYEGTVVSSAFPGETRPASFTILAEGNNLVGTTFFTPQNPNPFRFFIGEMDDDSISEDLSDGGFTSTGTGQVTVVGNVATLVIDQTLTFENGFQITRHFTGTRQLPLTAH